MTAKKKVAKVASKKVNTKKVAAVKEAPVRKRRVIRLARIPKNKYRSPAKR